MTERDDAVSRVQPFICPVCGEQHQTDPVTGVRMDRRLTDDAYELTEEWACGNCQAHWSARFVCVEKSTLTRSKP
jgi:hypothetical protein